MNNLRPTVLFTWELGGAHGHLGRLLPLARALSERGCDVVLACRHLEGLPNDLSGLTIVPAPAGSFAVADALREPASFADILFNDGVCEFGAMQGRLRAWRGLFERVRPGLVVMDYSPYATLAARACESPVALVGTGFACPPNVSPLPDIRMYQNHYPDRMLMTEQAVLAAVNQGLKALGVPALQRLGAMFDDVALNLIASTRELDHYAPQRTGQEPSPTYCGTWGEVSGFAPEWPKGNGPKVFAYLKNTRLTPHLLKRLDERGLPTLVYVSGLERPERFYGRAMTVSATPFDIAAVAQSAEVAICHAGLTTTDTLLHAGIPQLLLPINIEQYLTAKNVVAMGAGVCSLLESREAVDQGLSQLFAELNALTSNAREFAARSPFSDRQSNLLSAVEHLQKLMPS
ncbi:MAG: nucleotide disphospho-sugar-binding domain-containing protein [Halieaceae bacterium]|nr:nucleotide disphospho-sugar-binding domain-containing protein [Halieaceae bacterium]